MSIPYLKHYLYANCHVALSLLSIKAHERPALVKCCSAPTIREKNPQ